MDEYLNCEMERGKKQKSNGKNREENQVGKEGRPKLKGKKTKLGRREGGKGIKNKREREKMTKKGRGEMT